MTSQGPQSAGASAADDDAIEIDEDVTVAPWLDEDGTDHGIVIDDLVVATAPDGSIVEETIDIVDREGRLVIEDEIVTHYDADAKVVSKDQVIIVAVDEER